VYFAVGQAEGRTDLLGSRMMRHTILLLLLPMKFYFEGDCDCLPPQMNAMIGAHDVMDAVVITDGHLTRCWDGWGHRAVALRKVE